jgi:hypothetical protein
MSASPYTAKLYVQNRKLILASKPLCAICGERPAGTVDHILSLHLGGDHSLENLQPACMSCNSRKGAQEGNRARSAVSRARNAAVKRADAERAARGPEPPPDTPPPPRRRKPTETPNDPEATPSGVLGRPDPNPEPPLLRISPKAGKPRAGSKGSATKPAEAGEILPRLETPVLGVQSYGPAFVELYERLGFPPLMPWQKRVLWGQLAHDESGKLLHRQSLVEVARQNGKSTCGRALLLGWLVLMPQIRGEKQTVISTAHALDLAVAMFQDLAPILEEKFGAKAKWSYGRNELEMPDGSRWYVRAATPSAGHGRSPDLVFADEAWDLSEEAIEQGLLPAQRARKSPLLSMWSTAGTEASKLLLRWREQGIRLVDNGGGGQLYFASYSPPPGCDLTDPENWRYANPAIGHTLELETLIAESQSPNRSAFLRASLNLWVASDQSWLEPGVWEKLVYTGDELPPATILALEHSQDGSRYVGLLAHPLPGGKVVVQTAFAVKTETEMWAAVEEKLPPSATLALPRSLEIHLPPRYAHRKTNVGYGELLNWTSLVHGMIVAEGRVLHLGDRDKTLAEHMARAVAGKTQAGVALSSQRSPGPIELARCAVWAIALSSKATWKARPSIGGSRRPRPR